LTASGRIQGELVGRIQMFPSADAGNEPRYTQRSHMGSELTSKHMENRLAEASAFLRTNVVNSAQGRIQVSALQQE